MNKSRATLLERLKELHGERRRLLQTLVQDYAVAIGSVSVVRRKCGNPNCHCASGAGHPQTLFLYKDESGRRRCKLVRKADEKKMHRAGERYRKCREALKRLRAIDAEEKQLLTQLLQQRSVKYE